MHAVICSPLARLEGVVPGFRSTGSRRRTTA